MSKNAALITQVVHLSKGVEPFVVPQGKSTSGETQGQIPKQNPVADRIVVVMKLL